MSGQAIAQEDRAAGVSPVPVLRAPWRVRAVSALADYRLALSFVDGTSGVADCSALLTSKNPGVYAGLADPEQFALVRLELGVPTWPNGADLDPAWLHDEISGGRTWKVPF